MRTKRAYRWLTMFYSKMLTKLAASIIALSSLAACGGSGGDKSTAPQDNGETINMEISGSVGDGPIVGATITFSDVNGKNYSLTSSGDNATYQGNLQLAEGFFPLIIKAEGGTDLVTNSEPDFMLCSAIVEPSQERISNINPHSTLITKTAQNLPGGINNETLLTAQSTVLRLFAFGLDPRIVADPTETQITADNAANISKSSEVLGEMVRRTRDELIRAGIQTSGDDIIDAIAADLVDGQMDGVGGERADKRIAALVNFISGQVLMEAAANRLIVNNAVATNLMDDAIRLTRPDTTVLTGDVIITAAMLEQIKNLANSAAAYSPLPALSNIIDQLSSLAGDQLFTTFTTLFPLEVSGGFTNIIQRAAQTTSEAELDEMNRAVNLRARPDEPGSFEFGAASYSIGEDGGVVEITINRLNGSDGDVTVSWMTQNATASANQDYNGFSWRTLTFADGENSRVERVSIINDETVEEDERFNLLLGLPTSGASIGAIAATVVTITNDDSDPVPQPGRFEFGAASYSISEDGGVVEITINRLNGSDGSVTVEWMTQGATATGNQDYNDFSWRALTFADGESSRVETISIIDDDIVEGDELFNILLGNPTGGASLGSTTTIAITIISDDYEPVSVLSTNPANQAYGVQVSKNINIEFDTLLDCLTITTQAITLTGSSGNVSVNIACSGSNVTLDPLDNLQPSTTYTATVSSSISSNTGEPMTDNYSWTFTTITGQALPALEIWGNSMIEAGQQWGEYLMNPDVNINFAINDTTYYDSQRIFFQIADYTGQDEPWNTYAQRAEEIYRDMYARPDYTMPGYRRFPHGIYMDFVRTGDSLSAEGIPLMRDAPAYSNPEAFSHTTAYRWYWQDLSREVAYAIGANVIAERAGYPRLEERMQMFIGMALNHINEWVTGERGNPDASKHRFAPFMFALTAEALISYYEWEVERGAAPDETIPNALRAAADFLWSARVTNGPNTGKAMWVPDVSGRSYSSWGDLGGSGHGAFRYEDCDCSPTGSRPSPALNLLIAPAYAWLFKHFGDPAYLAMGDLIWEGGVGLAQSAIRYSGKQFNQNYRWSFEYVKWRNEGVSLHSQ